MSKSIRGGNTLHSPYHEDKLFYDESKRRFLYMKEASLWQQHRMSAPYFLHVGSRHSSNARI